MPHSCRLRCDLDCTSRGGWLFHGLLDGVVDIALYIPTYTPHSSCTGYLVVGVGLHMADASTLHLAAAFKLLRALVACRTTALEAVFCMYAAGRYLIKHCTHHRLQSSCGLQFTAGPSEVAGSCQCVDGVSAFKGMQAG